MSQHLTRRRLIAGGLAGAGLAAVPVLGASEAYATAVCVVPPENGMWANDEITEVETIRRVRLRYECPRRLKDLGSWHFSTWWSTGGRAAGRERFIGEVPARRVDGWIVAEYPYRGPGLPILVLRARRIPDPDHRGRLSVSWQMQKLPGARTVHRSNTFRPPEVGA